MTHKVQHEQHESTRYAYERRSRKGAVTGGGGTLAFASIYTMREGVGPKALPLWYVERRIGDVWVTAPRDMQGRTIEEAKNIVAGYNRATGTRMYRIVAKNGLGAYNPVK